MIDPDVLLSFAIPEVRQRLTPRDAAFYALSVGLGQDPLDNRQRVFAEGREALPSMAVILGHPGFWLADPRTGVDAVRVVHGEQAITLHAPLPVDGTVVGRTRVTGLVDKGAGKGALLFTRKDLSDAKDGRLLATTESTSFLRGDGGFGGPAGPAKAPAALPDIDAHTVVDLPSRPEQALYYRLNGDDNPLHADPDVAAQAGFPRPILHGLCTLGIAAHALLRVLCAYDASRLGGLSLRFSAPVYPGETIRTEIWPDGSFRARVVERDVVVITHGRATIR